MVQSSQRVPASKPAGPCRSCRGFDRARLQWAGSVIEYPMAGLETSAAQAVARAAVIKNVKTFMGSLFLEFLEFGLFLFPSIIEIGDGLVNTRLHFGRQGLQGLGTFGFSSLAGQPNCHARGKYLKCREQAGRARARRPVKFLPNQPTNELRFLFR